MTPTEYLNCIELLKSDHVYQTIYKQYLKMRSDMMYFRTLMF